VPLPVHSNSILIDKIACGNSERVHVYDSVVHLEREDLGTVRAIARPTADPYVRLVASAPHLIIRRHAFGANPEIIVV
jgi:hypothetical protein